MIRCIVWGLVFPFAGTVLGAGLALVPGVGSPRGRRIFSAGAAVLMGWAAVFGLLLPALERSPWAWAGGLAGAGFLLIPGAMTRHRGWLVALAVILHNIPEGMAAGLSFGGWLTGAGVTAGEAVSVGIGIGVQNVPDGAMVALPLAEQGMPPRRAFLAGALSGLAEPLAAAAMVFFARALSPWLPVLMGFAAGAMGCVVMTELLPAALGKES